MAPSTGSWRKNKKKTRKTNYEIGKKSSFFLKNVGGAFFRGGALFGNVSFTEVSRVLKKNSNQTKRHSDYF